MRSTPAVQGLVYMVILEYGDDQWLCELFLFELRMSLSGAFVRVEDVLRSASACRVKWLGRRLM